MMYEILAQEMVKDALREAVKNRLIKKAKQSQKIQNRQRLAKLARLFRLTQTNKAGDRNFSFASGHGGQYIVLLDEPDMVIVATADPFWQQHDDESWKHESAVIELVGKFISTLPRE